MSCPKCKKDMRLVERKGTIEGFEWCCRVQSKENPHFVSRSVRKATRGLLATDHVILKPGQVTWMTPELAPTSPNYHINGRKFQLSTDLTCIAALHGRSLEVLRSNS
ncbi:hypothetical protein TNCV_3793801 [Trichonephila clavipes]|nr:hypothetical protein TNCV_3793801 [Trichonephila clavipes]